LDNKSAIQIAKKVLAADLVCETGSFDKESITVNIARESEGARRFPVREHSLNIATFGAGIAISCSPNRLQWIKENLWQLSRDEVFSASTISLMEQLVSRDNQTIAGPDLKYICTPETYQTQNPVEGIEISVIEDKEVLALYKSDKFTNAIGLKHNPKRPRVIATTAVNKGEIIGVAAASADCDEMYQVGIDVLPEYRKSGIGKELVSVITKAIFDLGKVPYYSSWANNIVSIRLAISVGYRPTWIEVYAINRSEGYSSI